MEAASKIAVLAVDGPAGAGKSSVCEALAQRLGFFFFSSGRIYRIMAAHLLDQGWQVQDPPPLVTLQHLRVKVDPQGQPLLWANEAPQPQRDLHTEAVSQAASTLSQHPSVRDLANQSQRETVAHFLEETGFAGVILEGRDIGSVVFPHAAVKVFLTASAQARALRRYNELHEKDPSLTLESVLKSIQDRDAQDQNRHTAPLIKAQGAIEVDTSSLTLIEVVDQIEALVKANQRYFS